MNFNSKKTYVGKKLKELRKERGLTLEEVGTEFGMKPQTLSNYEKGKRSIDIDILFELAQFYDVSIDYLFGLSDNSTPQRDAFVADELETIGFSDEAIDLFWRNSSFVELLNDFISHDKFDTFCELTYFLKSMQYSFYDNAYRSFLLSQTMHEIITDILNSWDNDFPKASSMQSKVAKESLDKGLKKYLYDNDLIMGLLYTNDEEKQKFKETFMTEDFRQFLDDFMHFLMYKGIIIHVGHSNVQINDCFK